MFQNNRVPTCAIFNPTAKGDKARRFRAHLDEIGVACSVKPTTGPGDATRLATAAVAEGFDTIVAAGGDGTVNEVLNGLAAAPEGLERARLAVLPLGTVNVFARELGLPFALEKAWQAILAGKERRIDLPFAEFAGPAGSQKRCFAQLAGAGLDARAIELVSWRLKKRIGPLAYVAAGLRAMAEKQPLIRVETEAQSATGALVLIGNGRLYGGRYRVFPEADLADGWLDVCVFPRVNWLVLARCGPSLLINGSLPASPVIRLRGQTVRLTSDVRVPFELDGEWCGRLPVGLTNRPRALRIIAP